MIIPDVNLLVHAYNRDSATHEDAAGWWEATNRRGVQVGLAWATILGFIRLTTGRTIYSRPIRVEDAIATVRSWLRLPNVRVITPGEDHAEILFGLLSKAGTGGNLTTDAHLAALAMEYRAEVASLDADFSRFPGLRWTNPLSGRK